MQNAELRARDWIPPYSVGVGDITRPVFKTKNKNIPAAPFGAAGLLCFIGFYFTLPRGRHAVNIVPVFVSGICGLCFAVIVTSS